MTCTTTVTFQAAVPAPVSLILLGDDTLVFERGEYDPELGTWVGLAPVTRGPSQVWQMYRSA